MAIQRCKGCSDLLPEDMVKFRFIEDTFRDLCQKWGYQEVRTPTLEYLHLFTATGTLTPDMLSKVYSFLDWDGWSGERVVLRPDGTIPVARLYIESLATKGTSRLFYVTSVFTFEPTGSQSRERWQLGAELLGADPILADIELVSLSLDTLKKLGLKNVTLKLSHAGLIRGVLKKARLSPEEEIRLFDELLDGKGIPFSKLSPDEPQLSRPLRLLFELKGKSSGYLKNLKPLLGGDSPGIASALNDFITVCDLLTSLGISYDIDIASGRGFEYYTGVMFQLFLGEEKIGGGGRYDALIPLMGGKKTPASGFALYLDKLMGVLDSKSLANPRLIPVLVKPPKNNLVMAFKAADRLKEAGQAAELFTAGIKPEGARFVLHVRNDGSFMLSDQNTHERRKASSLDAVLRHLEEAARHG